MSIEKSVRVNFAGSFITNIDLFDEKYYAGSTDYFHSVMSISVELPKNGENEYDLLWSIANLINGRIKWIKSNSEGGESNNVNV